MAIDRGRYKSVVCCYQRDTRTATFCTIDTTPEDVRERCAEHTGARVVIEACANAGRVPATTTRSSGGAESDHGDGPQVGTHQLQHLRYGVAYQKKTEVEYAEQHRQRQEKNLHQRAKEMGV